MCNGLKKTIVLVWLIEDRLCKSFHRLVHVAYIKTHPHKVFIWAEVGNPPRFSKPFIGWRHVPTVNMEQPAVTEQEYYIQVELFEFKCCWCSSGFWLEHRAKYIWQISNIGHCKKFLGLKDHLNWQCYTKQGQALSTWSDKKRKQIFVSGRGEHVIIIENRTTIF